jgi:hypothetical protein
MSNYDDLKRRVEFLERNAIRATVPPIETCQTAWGPNHQPTEQLAKAMAYQPDEPRLTEDEVRKIVVEANVYSIERATLMANALLAPRTAKPGEK